MLFARLEHHSAFNECDARACLRPAACSRQRQLSHFFQHTRVFWSHQVLNDSMHLETGSTSGVPLLYPNKLMSCHA